MLDYIFTYATIGIAFKQKDMIEKSLGYLNEASGQGEIVNILLKIKNSFLPTKQILIGL
ncbi:hypothetical protein KAM348_44290 [Aeromonas caviae]|uniref:Uncharacterized protein n=1 Tax=Aeromonas caviae TaxID=648 RepID=A0AAI9KVV8_AERCA|nr:hypothetical protein KAM348_44290 [Aeromonas caviae]